MTVAFDIKIKGIVLACILKAKTAKAAVKQLIGKPGNSFHIYSP